MRLNRVVNALQGMPFIPIRSRLNILRRAGLKIGQNVTIFNGTFFGSEKCEIGDGTFISVLCFIDGSDWVRIGANVNIAAGVKLVSSTHEIGGSTRRAGPELNATVNIGDGLSGRLVHGVAGRVHCSGVHHRSGCSGHKRHRTRRALHRNAGKTHPRSHVEGQPVRCDGATRTRMITIAYAVGPLHPFK